MLRRWPATAKIKTFKLNVEAHGIGGQGLGGHRNYVTGPGAAFAGELETAPASIADASSLRAFLHSLRGRAGAFLLELPVDFATTNGLTYRRARYTDGTDFTDGAQYSDYLNLYVTHGSISGAATADAATLDCGAAIGASAFFAAGSYLFVGNPESDGQLLRVISVSGNVATVRPRVRKAHASGTVVSVGRITARLRLNDSTPAVPMSIGRSREVQIAIAEDY